MTSKERQEHFKDRMAEKKKLRISFQTFDELCTLQNEKRFKISSRSTLGLKPNSDDDWIQTFNIGNIMHLQAVGFDEFNAGTVSKGLVFQSFVLEQIGKDPLLYKVLYVIVAYFCIGTELRFLASICPVKYTIKDSELWHAKAIHIASFFLPSDCPLIQHITQSYSRHHLRPKIKRRQEQMTNLLQPRSQ